jgi:hypothetical protein
MRRSDIASDSDVRSIRAFSIGSPTYLVAHSSDNTRWRTHLGVPIWHQTDRMLTGVITLASTLEPANSSVVEARTRGINQVVPIMKEVGRRLTEDPLFYVDDEDTSADA